MNSLGVLAPNQAKLAAERVAVELVLWGWRDGEVLTVRKALSCHDAASRDVYAQSYFSAADVILL